MNRCCALLRAALACAALCVPTLAPARTAGSDHGAQAAAEAVAAQAAAQAVAVQAQALAREAAERAAPGLRVQVQVGQLDARLKLAPCPTVQPYLPTGTRLWGNARIGLRCTDGPVRWNVFLPLTVDVYGPGWVAAGALAAGSVLGAADVRPAEVLLSGAAQPTIAPGEPPLGRTLARPLAAGQALRQGDLRARQWFAAGDMVRIQAGGAGWRVQGEGQALNAGIEGQLVRVRTESGRVVSGLPVGQRQVEVPL